MALALLAVAQLDWAQNRSDRTRHSPSPKPKRHRFSGFVGGARRQIQLGPDGDNRKVSTRARATASASTSALRGAELVEAEGIG
ncbi:hypothetical protein NL676_002365 [Syzygium grande]|nr:hypothetical protein NL676_002365 [Syzygium grande]